jgi:hypothetical protein
MRRLRVRRTSIQALDRTRRYGQFASVLTSTSKGVFDSRRTAATCVSLANTVELKLMA